MTEHPPAPADNPPLRFSLRRTLVAAVLAMAIVLPALYAFDYGRMRSEPPGHMEGEPSGQPGLRSSARDYFDLSSATIPAAEILSGGPPVDGIPALSTPELVEADKAAYLQPTDRVIGYAHGEARAYPLKILNYHEIVNDQIADLQFAITYCPLCDSAAAFNRRAIGGRELGVSGLLYNSNVLMYDRGEGRGLWSQLRAEAVSGPDARQDLPALPIELTTWADWKSRHPATLVLSVQTGHHRDYQVNPYARYFASTRTMFPVKPSSDRLPARQRLLGVWSNDVYRAYPVPDVAWEQPQLADTIDGNSVTIEYVPPARTLRVVDADPGVYWMYSFWFSWYAMHPDTEIFGESLDPQDGEVVPEDATD